MFVKRKRLEKAQNIPLNASVIQCLSERENFKIHLQELMHSDSQEASVCDL
jgi:hypothetical protein